MGRSILTGVAVIFLVVAITLLVGALAVGALSVFGLVTFSWLKALAAGVLINIIGAMFRG